MRLIRWFLIAALVLAGGIAIYQLLGASPPEVPFAKVQRGDLASTVVTNGQVEPLDGAEVRSAAGGRVVQVLVSQGQQVNSGAPLLRVDDAEAQTALRDAQSALLAAEARLLEAIAGGNPLHRKELEGSLGEAKLTLQQAQDEAAKLRRLVEAKAATARELELEERRVAVAQERVNSVSAQLEALLSDADREDARAAVAAARARAEAANRRVSETVARSPATGTLYEFPMKAGAWLQPGEFLGRVGDLQILRILVYVDEPELGRIREGLAVSIRWDALPGVTWKGLVDRLPTRIQTFGTRQVGEVVCRIQNPDGNLLPGANVNAEILSAQATGALVVPKQAIRRRLGEEGVWKLEGTALRWQPVRVGITSVTQAEVQEGLQESESVALLVDRELRDGLKVQPTYP
ncbi:MAG: efflux RND transporter periplasmic adaptor subunit [Bryobacterales bacterium]|nr:efflux RND transporter periplasmic adaptor subunit [Bryobacterales bacterium]